MFLETFISEDTINGDKEDSSEAEEWEIPSTTCIPGSSSPQNGYTKPSLIPHSKSAHASFYVDPKDHFVDVGSLDNLVENEQNNTIGSCDSISNSCDLNSVNVDTSIGGTNSCSPLVKKRHNSVKKIKRNFAFMKKSASATSGLGRKYEKNHNANGYALPFSTSFSLSYFTSTFQASNTDDR